MSAYLEITMHCPKENLSAAAGIYSKYRAPFLETIKGATSKELLLRQEDVQVLHGFETLEDAQAYLSSELFQKDVSVELAKLWNKYPDIRIYNLVG